MGPLPLHAAGDVTVLFSSIEGLEELIAAAPGATQAAVRLISGHACWPACLGPRLAMPAARACCSCWPGTGVAGIRSSPSGPPAAHKQWRLSTPPCPQVALHNEAVRAALGAAGGYENREAGGAFLLVFQCVDDAASFALDAQVRPLRQCASRLRWWALARVHACF